MAFELNLRIGRNRGESQKLAIARALYENAGVLILDEPANSLDPLAEAEMYERMFAAGKDRTMILISHRLYSTRKADRICYIENGKIVEEGTHEELMRANRKYASMYQLQASLYEKDSNEATINETTSKMNVEKTTRLIKGAAQ